MKLWPLFVLISACSSTTFVTNVIEADAGDASVGMVDAGSDAALADAGADVGDAGPETTCPALLPVAAGTSTSVEPAGNRLFCDPRCGPAHGYVAASGTPQLSGCVQIVGTGNFCCPASECTPDALGFQCPINDAAAPFAQSWACPESPAASPPRLCSGVTYRLSNDSGITFACCDP